MITISTERSRSLGLSAEWPAEYLRDHTLHFVVIFLFAIYPFVFDFLVSELGIVAQMILPRPRTIMTVMWLGLFAVSFDFISGYTGYLSFGHAAFFGIGAYFVVLAYNGQLPGVPAELPFMFLMLVGALLAVVAAFLIGLVSFRLTGVYFAMITLGFAEIMYVIANNWDFLTPGAADPSDGTAAGSPDGVSLFQPEIGILGIEQLTVEIGPFGQDHFMGFYFGSPRIVSYMVIGLIVVICYFAMQRMIHSPFGRTMIAIRENEERASAIGFRTIRFKMGAYMISAFFGGIAGALMVSYEQTVDPTNTFFFLVTGFALVAAIIGGLGTLAGPIYGYVFLEGVEEFLQREGGGGGLQPFLREYLPAGILETNIGNNELQGLLDAFMTGHGEFYAGIIFVIFVLYVPIGMLGTLRLRLGSASVAKWVGKRVESARSGGTNAAPNDD